MLGNQLFVRGGGSLTIGLQIKRFAAEEQSLITLRAFGKLTQLLGKYRVSLGKKLGLDPQKLFDVVSTSSGNCWAVSGYCPIPGVGPVSPADNDYQPGFAAELMVKDTGLSQQAADAVGAATPLGAHAAELFRKFVTETGKGKDFSGIVKMIEAMER